MPRKKAAAVCCAAAGCARLAKAPAGAGRLFCPEHEHADAYWAHVPCLLCLSAQHAVRDCVLFREQHAHPPAPARPGAGAVLAPAALGAQLRRFCARPCGRGAGIAWHCSAREGGACFWYRAPEGAAGVTCTLWAPGAAVTERTAQRVPGCAGPWWALAVDADALAEGTQHQCAAATAAGEVRGPREAVPPLAALRWGPPRAAVPPALAAAAAAARRPPAPDPAVALAQRDEAFASAERELHEIAVDDAFAYVAAEATAAKHQGCPTCAGVCWVALAPAPPAKAKADLCACDTRGIFAVRRAEFWHPACVQFALYYAAAQAPHSEAHACVRAALQALWEWARSQYTLPIKGGQNTRLDDSLEAVPGDQKRIFPGNVLRVFASEEAALFAEKQTLRPLAGDAAAHGVFSAALVDGMLASRSAEAAGLLVSLRMREDQACWVVPSMYVKTHKVHKAPMHPLLQALPTSNRARRLRAEAFSALDFDLVRRACGGDAEPEPCVAQPAPPAGDAGESAPDAREALYERPLSILTREQAARYPRLLAVLGARLDRARGGALDLTTYQDAQPVFVLLTSEACAAAPAAPLCAGLWVCVPCDPHRAAHAACAAAHADMHHTPFDPPRTLALWARYGTPALPAVVRLDAAGFKMTPSCGVRVVCVRGLAALRAARRDCNWSQEPRHAFQRRNLPRSEPAWLAALTRTRVFDDELVCEA